jgi:hypothetical protein
MMKKLLMLLSLFSVFQLAKAQNRNALVKTLNHYIEYSNANITALSLSLNTLERYNGLFNDYLRKDRLLGGEPYEKPKASPFVDEEVFTMNEDNPEFLYSISLRESALLPLQLRTELNAHMKQMLECSQQMVVILDSMSNLFSGPMIAVTNNPQVLPYQLLSEAKRQLQLSKSHRDNMQELINTYYVNSCTLTAAKNDYIHSVKPLHHGLALCQSMMNDLNQNDSSRISHYVQSIDSLCEYLDRSEMTLLKGITHFGKSRQFPNESVVNGFDLFAKYEDIVDQLRAFSATGKQFLNPARDSKFPAGKCFHFHNECATRFNSTLGLLYYYNEYVLLIGGGKMKMLAEGIGIIYKGWGDESHSLPVRTQLLGMKETPAFEIVIY